MEIKAKRKTIIDTITITLTQSEAESLRHFLGSITFNARDGVRRAYSSLSLDEIDEAFTIQSKIFGQLSNELEKK